MIGEQEIFKECVDQWGIESQMDMLVEECAELIQAVNKFKRRKGRDGTMDNFFEELADVEIMSGQMRHYFGGEEIDKWKEKKFKYILKHLKK